MSLKENYICHNTGCDQSFVHQRQRSSHAEKCTKPKPNKVELVSKNHNNTYTCKTCNKIEPPSAHFKKDQYTLHGTVVHSFDEDGFNKYIYHFSNDNSHDSQFSYLIVHHLMRNNEQCLIFCFKSGNCSQQYKSCFVFANRTALAKKYNKTTILYYGVSGHGKGLVDFMSSFRVKGPCQKSIITEKKFFNDGEQVKEHLKQKHLHKPNLVYKVVSEDHLAERRKKPREEFKILQCEKLHMIAFFPDDRIMECEFEPGRIIKKEDVNSEDDKIDGSEHEENEIPKESFFSHTEKGSYVALHSPPQASKLLNLCKVLSCETATTSISIFPSFIAFSYLLSFF